MYIHNINLKYGSKEGRSFWKALFLKKWQEVMTTDFWKEYVNQKDVDQPLTPNLIRIMENRNTVAKIIEGYGKKNIHIEVLCDGFKLGMSVCYRGVITYLNSKGEWVSDDVGCYGDDWQTAFDEVVKYAELVKSKSSINQ